MNNNTSCKTDVASPIGLTPLEGQALSRRFPDYPAVHVIGVGATGIQLLNALHSQGSRENETFFVAGAIEQTEGYLPELDGAELVFVLASPSDDGALRDLEILSRRAQAAGALVFAMLALPLAPGVRLTATGQAVVEYTDATIFLPAGPHASLLRHLLDVYVFAITGGDACQRPLRTLEGMYLNVSETFSGGVEALVGVGRAEGTPRSDRVQRAVDMAIASIGASQLAGAAGVLILMTSGHPLQLHEIVETREAFHTACARDATPTLVVQIDARMPKSLRIAVIATGPSA